MSRSEAGQSKELLILDSSWQEVEVVPLVIGPRFFDLLASPDPEANSLADLRQGDRSSCAALLIGPLDPCASQIELHSACDCKSEDLVESRRLTRRLNCCDQKSRKPVSCIWGVDLHQNWSADFCQHPGHPSICWLDVSQLCCFAACPLSFCSCKPFIIFLLVLPAILIQVYSSNGQMPRASSS